MAHEVGASGDAVIEDSGVPDAIEEDAKEGPVEQLPNDTLVFLLGSRYCETDKLADIAWQLLDVAVVGGQGRGTVETGGGTIPPSHP